MLCSFHTYLAPALRGKKAVYANFSGLALIDVKAEMYINWNRVGR